MSDVKREYLIRKRGAYYRPNSQGYTTSAIQAGRYTFEEAQDISHPNGPGGPRDGMDYIHESEIRCEDWRDYTALRARLEAAEKERDEADALAKAAFADMASNNVRLAETARRAEAAELEVDRWRKAAEKGSIHTQFDLATTRRDAYERAAKVAETCPGWADSEASPDRIAAAIRALANEAET